ncbi:MAG: hypothetical protein WC477_07585 [Patescibacteria group bacterium]
MSNPKSNPKGSLLSEIDFEDFGVKTNDELLEKLKSPKWRLSHLYKILDKRGKIVTFKPNFFQRAVLRLFHWRMIFLKARQLGFSTFVEIFILDRCLFHKNTPAAIVADKAENAKKLLKKIIFAWENMNPNLKEYLGITSVSDSVSSIEWSNGSSVIAGTTIHAGMYMVLHISELGPLCEESAEKAEQVIQSAMPTVPDSKDTFIFIESTSRGEGNLFHSKCIDAADATKRAELECPENPNKLLHFLDFKFIFAPWWQEPTYRLATKEESLRIPISKEDHKYFDDIEEKIGRKLSIRRRAWYVLKRKSVESESSARKNTMRVEYPSTAEEAFLSGTDKFFDPDKIQTKIKTDVRAPLESIPDMLNTGYWRIYARWKPGHRYGLGADTSMGVGGHHSTCVVEDFTENEIVATYKSNKIDQVNFAHEISRAGRWYGTCIVAPEINYGGATIETLKEEYPNIYKFHILGGEDPKETERLGWLANSNTKGNALVNLRSAMQDEDAALVCPDPGLLQECLFYGKEEIYLTDTVKRAKGMTNHYDLLTAAAIAHAMLMFADYGEDSDNEMAAVCAERRTRKRGFS